MADPTAALAWLNDLAQWLGKWFPRLLLIQPVHHGVRFGPRGQAVDVGCGLKVYWPITHQVVLVPVTTQSLQLCPQILPGLSVDGIVPHVRVCAVAIQFRVVDAVRASVKVLHVHALIDNRATAAVARHVDLSADPAAWARAVLVDVSRELEPFGVHVECLDFTQRGTGVALQNISNWNWSDHASGDRPT